MSVPNIGANGTNDINLPNISFKQLLGADNDNDEGISSDLKLYFAE